LFIPDATTEQVRWFADLMRTTTQPEIAARILESFGAINVRALLPKVKVPTVVVHARGDARIPFEQGRLLAAEIPNASFVSLESRNHILIETEPAWARFCETFNEVMGINPGNSSAKPVTAVDLPELTARENAVLRLVAQGASNGDIARRLFISEKTVRNHLTNIFEKIGVDSRARAVVVARDRGVA
jgi:DNA-binding CsgD family transcriptional regulator